MRRTLLVGFLAGCAGGPTSAPSSPPQPKPPIPAQQRAHAPRLAIELRAAEGALRVTVEVDGPVAELRDLRGALPGAVSALAVSDQRGALSARLVEQSGAARIELDRPAEPPLRVSYAVTPRPGSVDFRVDPTELRAPGAVLVLPAAWVDSKVPVRIRLGADGASDARSASTFGLGADVSRELRVRDLASGYYLVGRLGDARFVADDGEDHAAWLGFFGFDPRWVAAEAAGVRAASDAWLGVKTPQRSALLLVSVTRPEHPFAFRSYAGGVVAEVQTGAAWSAPARIRLGQELVGRWVGGALRLGGEDARWWSDGASRAIAREVLFELGVLTADERAEELSTLLVVEALSPLAAEPLDALAKKGTDQEALRASTARGALVVSLVEARIRKATGGKRGLRELVRGLFERAAREGKTTLPMTAFDEALSAELGPAGAREILEALRGGAPVPLPADLLAPCHRLRARPVAPFVLGVSVSRAEPPVVDAVVAGSAAERAGVRVGDRVRSLRYLDGRADVPAKAALERAGKKLELQWVPGGAPKPGRVFERVRGVKDERCG